MPRPIDADALADLIETKGKEFGVTVANRCTFRTILSLAPTLDYAPVRHGYWIRQDDTYTRFMCSVCELKNYPIKYSYCPNCGAKMDAKEDVE